MNRVARLGFQSLVDAGTAVLFVAAIFLPLTLSGLGIGDAKAPDENRKLAARPEFAFDVEHVRSFSRDYEAYFNDHFGLRNRLIRIHHRLKLEGLGISPTHQAAVGKEGWLYLLAHQGAEYQRAAPWPDERVAAYAAHLVQRRDWLAARGIRCLFVVAPNKESIYPEYLPGASRALATTSILDQLYSHLQSHTEVEFLDLRPALRDAKRLGPVYFKHDTHWNDLGRYVAYREIVLYLRRWFDTLEPIAIDQFEQTRKMFKGGDLAELMAATDMLEEEWLILKRPGAAAVQGPLAVPGYPNQGVRHDLNVEAFENSKATVRALLMRDSFGDRLVPFLDVHFGRLVCWPYTPFDTGIVIEEKPDVVIMEIAERFLLSPLAEEEPAVREARPQPD